MTPAHIAAKSCTISAPDDFPPYVTMVIVGHIVVAALLLVEERFPGLPVWLHMIGWTALSLVLCLAMLPPVKGSLDRSAMGAQNARIRDRDRVPQSGHEVTIKQDNQGRKQDNQGRKIDRDTDLTAVLNEEIWPRVQRMTPNGVRPRLASTLILLDRTEAEPKVLMGRRNPASKFMPDKFVFPGGRVEEPGDRKMNAAGALPPEVERRLAKVVPRSRHPCPAPWRSARSAKPLRRPASCSAPAIWERPSSAPDGEWRKFAAQGFYPQLDNIHFIARATTPPRQARRFDTIFLAAEAADIATQVDGAVGPEHELVELVWVPMSKAHDLELSLITSVVLHELERRIAAGMGHYLPAPWVLMSARRAGCGKSCR